MEGLKGSRPASGVLVASRSLLLLPVVLPSSQSHSIAEIAQQQFSLILDTHCDAVSKDLTVPPEKRKMDSLPIYYNSIPINYRPQVNYESTRPQRRQALSISLTFGLCILFGLLVLSIINGFIITSSIRGLFTSPNEPPQTPTSDVNAAWEYLKGGEHCLRYATREYTALLKTVDLPAGEDPMKACRDTPAEIHGVVLYTNFCQNLGFGRGIWGFWTVDFNEPDCETKWGQFDDLGCVDDRSYPARRVESRLENLQSGSDWQFMCVTTPADINGHHYQTPMDCLNLGHSNILGLWDIPDNACSMAFGPDKETED
ncbi:hypothetical protein D9619_012785 [Psilocybe cf. subviscida]|uniref:Uncharacterized protein n=1 Tax=Psilocybe cf. subviscida TaxID=2480587 RepID=A0A8H5EQX3_9AGAR|nr:hypothetical protein D9619_012785 [Psilocybe cf. subviscida]